MNKRICILLAIALCILPILPATTANAAETNDVVLTMSGGKIDNLVYVDVAVVANSGVSTLKLRLDYDKTALTYVRALNTSEALRSLAYTTTGKETDSDGIRYLFGPNSIDTSTGLLMRLYFGIADETADADVTTKVNLVVEGALADKNDIKVAVYGAKILLHANGQVDVDTDRPVQMDVGLIVAICLAVAAVIALVVIVCVRMSAKKSKSDRTAWKKFD